MRILGIEIHRHRDSSALAWLLGVTRPNVVIDVGANEGQFQMELVTAGFRGRSIAVEPLPHLAAKLTEQGIETHAVAAGEVDDTAQLTVYRDTSLSSLHPMRSDMAKELWPDAHGQHVSEQITVPVCRLDALLRDIPGDIFLKIDTQGHDLQALRGAEGILDRVVMVQIELAFQHLYETEAIEDHLETLRTFGFGLAALTPISRTANTAIVEADGLFVRNRPRPL